MGPVLLGEYAELTADYSPSSMEEFKGFYSSFLTPSSLYFYK